MLPWREFRRSIRRRVCLLQNSLGTGASGICVQRPLRCGRIDPGCGGFCRRLWCTVDEALRVLAANAIEGVLAGGVNRVGLAKVNLIRCHKTDADVVMILIVPVKITAQEDPRVFDAAETRRKLRLILQGLELGLGIRIVVTYVRPAVGLGDAQIGQEQGYRL